MSSTRSESRAPAAKTTPRERVSVVVPILNESSQIDELLDHLAATRPYEIIAVDGGSRDGSRHRLHASRLPGLRVVQAPAGRARQMNEGALRASGNILLFLHADTRLPSGALTRIVDGLAAHPDIAWGRFDVRFDHPGPLLRVVAAAMNRRSAWTWICTGDQALFVYRRLFLETGGFAPIELMEDIELSRRLKRRSRPLRITEPVLTSARRWRAHGAWSTILMMWRLRWWYWWGVPASRLAKHYHDSDLWKPS